MYAKKQSVIIKRHSNAASALDDILASHRRLEITTINEPARIRGQIIQLMHELLDEKADKIETAMEGLSSRLSALIDNSSKSAKEMSIIESLTFPTISEREWRIAEAHLQTYDWLFEETKPSGPRYSGVSMLDWLQRRHGIYWVSGKAGSGKSTLMKHLYNHERTLAALNVWTGEKHLITASFFFWNAGTEMQKSQQGLLQTLLYHVLRQRPALVRFICRLRWDSSNPGHSMSPWSRREILQALASSGDAVRRSARFCFFVDGLDEYEGDHTELIKVLNDFASNDIKVRK